MNAPLPDLQAVSTGTLFGELAKRYWNHRKRWIAFGIWVLVIVTYVALTAASLIPAQFSRTGSKWVLVSLAAFMVRTFAFHAGLGILVLAIPAILMRRGRLLLAMLPLVVWTMGPELWYSLPKSAEPVSGETVRVVSANLFAGTDDHRAAAASILEADPDVLLLQEYTPECHESFSAAFGDTFQSVEILRRRDSFGVAMYSKRQAVEAIEVMAPLKSTSLPMMRGVFEIGGRRVAFYNLHLHPPSGIHGTRLMRLKFDALLDMLAAEELPAVVMGDFNATCNSEIYDAMAERGYRDAHRLAGTGRGTTWCNRGLFSLFPGFQIDHIFLSRELTAVSCETLSGPGSDHRALLAEIGFRSNPIHIND